jgi:protein-tyrosine-phosphatase
MAEAFARALGADAASAGSKPSGEINPRTTQVMAEKGVSLAGQRSKSLDEIPSGEWDYVVTMGCGDACPWVPARHREDWDLPDPKTLDDAGFRAVRDEIEARVRKLLASAPST